MNPMPFEYAVLRVVPRVDRGEFVNGAVLLYCQQAAFLGMTVRTDLSPIGALWPQADLEAIVDALAAAREVAHGAASAGGAGQADPGRRFRWLTAPRSTIIQTSAVHCGFCTDPAAVLDRLLAGMVL